MILNTILFFDVVNLFSQKTDNAAHFTSSWVELSYSLIHPEDIVCSDVPPPPKCFDGPDKIKAEFFCGQVQMMNGPLKVHIPNDFLFFVSV